MLRFLYLNFSAVDNNEWPSLKRQSCSDMLKSSMKLRQLTDAIE